MPVRAKISCIIYDLDGTLLDTETLSTQAINHGLSRFGKKIEWATKKKLIGLRAADWTKIVLEDVGLADEKEYSCAELAADWEAHLKTLYHTVQPMKGAVWLTSSAHSAGVRQAVATSSSHEGMTAKFTHHPEMRARFEHVVTGDDPEVKNGKPAPDIFLLAAKRMGVAPEECLVFEDAPSGLAAGLAAGMHVVAIPEPGMDLEPFGKATQLLKSMEEFTPAEWGLPAFPAPPSQS